MFAPWDHVRPGQLTKVYNGQGGTIEIEYAPAPLFNELYPGDVRPIAQENTIMGEKNPHTGSRNLVKSVTVYSGVKCMIPNDPYYYKTDLVGKTEYRYHNGLYYPGSGSCGRWQQ